MDDAVEGPLLPLMPNDRKTYCHRAREANAMAESKDPYEANAREEELLSQSDSAGFVGILRLRRTFRFAYRPAALRMTVKIVLRKKAA